MNCIVILNNNYTYEGDIKCNEPNGNGKFIYANGDIYEGECKFGKPHGYGFYKYILGPKYIGFFSSGKFNGIGTYEDSNNILKGPWSLDKKNGIFIETDKKKFKTYRRLYIDNVLYSYYEDQYIDRKYLITYKKHHSKQIYQKKFNGKEKKCITCTVNNVDAVCLCGHLICCYQCLTKCKSCPICRKPIENIIRLYVS